MALSIIILLYVCVGILAAAGSIFISQKLFSAKAEQIFFALFLVAIAAFYLAFTAYFEDHGAWRLETGAVIVFAVFGILGVRLPVVLIIGMMAAAAISRRGMSGLTRSFGNRHSSLILSIQTSRKTFSGCSSRH